MNTAPAPLQDLSPQGGSPRPIWHAGLLSFIASAALVVVLVAVSQPFDRGPGPNLPAYDTGFQSGLESGARAALEEETELGAVAFGRGREAGRAETAAADPAPSTAGTGTSSIWLRTTLEALDGLQADDAAGPADDTITFQRGYRDGYAIARDGER